MTAQLNLSCGDASVLMRQLQMAIRRARRELRLELLGPGILLSDTSLMLFEILRTRPASLCVHVHTWTCLCDGAALLWLGGDTRSMRSDTWIQIPRIPDAALESSAVTVDESPSDTDLRTVLRHLGEWLPVEEASGRRLFRAELEELGLLENEALDERLLSFFAQGRG